MVVICVTAKSQVTLHCLQHWQYMLKCMPGSGLEAWQWVWAERPSSLCISCIARRVLKGAAADNIVANG